MVTETDSTKIYEMMRLKISEAYRANEAIDAAKEWFDRALAEYDELRAAFERAPKQPIV